MPVELHTFQHNAHAPCIVAGLLAKLASNKPMMRAYPIVSGHTNDRGLTIIELVVPTSAWSTLYYSVMVAWRRPVD